ncbi:TrkH family potassium uptake protein [Mameliella sediminis]|uniref:TrkH family potassium uptake protein n=1 Tax=Mameliella sediminis TaxID=2836866 RepID=UPI001C48FE11|nr:potassium transporter TrkG [Mameliella sediminis]MBY6114694.1 TrkH family potassium uptake protein [Antarctobacter heliothermus]MBY6144267.1 TrkH family potassium uptake protein [Mameliella alba]MBV7392825.1 TrkH family potassium uptake protein [Mameliella sediminis]MBY6161442.1 TrkH family potassium uptake protein [Mameliella alba]MBY6170092.1 TrkH family potassium uptake protein [Mameliella alba]
MKAIARLPLFLLLTGLGSVSMLLPAGFAYAIEEFHDARSFFYGAILGLILTTLVALALGNRQHNESALRQLVALAAGVVFMPLVFAVPFHEAVRTTGFSNAYFEMVSSFTTTGATLFDAARLSGPEHLWRAQVGWMGGLVMWIAASAILAPLALGGFEVTASGEPGQSFGQGALNTGPTSPAQRLMRSTEVLFPIYTGLTIALAVMLLVAGDPPLVALSHAMSVMSTSGISPLPDPGAAPSGLAGEMILFCFLVFALSRLTFSTDTRQERGLVYDPEFRLGLIIVVAVPLALFMRHWVAAFDVGEEQNWVAGLRALWGGLFTAASFLTTTGFVSGDWDTAQDWSGLPTPGIILVGLALIGGGVATTAGGVKLLRVYALYLNGKREIERLVHPSSVGRAGPMGRRIRREGAFIAWVFFMFFALALAALTLILGLYGVDFERAIVLTIATLSNTGPLIGAASAAPIDLTAMGWDARLILCGAMVLGRLELLAIIVMISPDVWRE